MRSSSVSSGYRLPWDDRPGMSGAVILGIRPETFEDAAFASPELPTIEAEVIVLEELGSDAHVFFHVDAARVAAGLDEEADEATDLVTDRGALLNARVDPRTTARVGDSTSPRFRSLSVPLLRRRDRRIAACAWPCGQRRAGYLGRALSHAAVLVLTSTGGRLRCSA